ncbi:hydrolase [Pelobium manganitolerans]|uniref:Hydrolase n=1 Tax=Pelobium manganitolerans TaxID=1842495 RepID=A0A419SA21_9SPHI|nr:alpha/beta fold hydrolase [Pelobium manganitolerans]RKD19035.1 hydrolase [Pelobium manganitolerans]
MEQQKFSKENFEIAGFNAKPIVGDITYANSYPDYLVIFVHGNKGFKDWGAHHLTAARFAAAGIYFLKFNFSHSGVKPDDLSDIKDLETFSLNTPIKELFDLDKVIAYAQDKFPHLQIVLLGHSRGGGLSILQTAKDKRVAKLITLAALEDFRKLWKPEEEAAWRETGVNYTENSRTKQMFPRSVVLLNDVLENQEILDTKKAAKQMNVPWLIVHGTADVAVDVSVAEEFHQLQPKSELLVINNADHVFGAVHPYTITDLPADLQTAVDASIKFVLKQ